MEKFKKVIKIKIITLSIIIILIGLIYPVLNKIIDSSNIPNFTKGFQLGMIIGIEGGLIIWVIKNLFSMRNESKLKELYIKENDERNILIMQKTGALILPICAISLGIASIIASFFNLIVVFTLVGVITFLAIIKVIIKIIYSNKY